MILNLTRIIEQWGEGWCQVCWTDKIRPYYEFCYESDIKDKHGNPLITTEIKTCEKCRSKINKNYKKWLN